METTFFIELNMKTADGFERFGCFEIGCDRKFALSLFSMLESRPAEGEEGVLQLDLVESYRGLPISIRVIDCSISELCRNVKIITRELFKRINLRPMQL
jgi:hypothetical protein